MAKDRLEALDPRKYILIKGAAVHNLKKVDVAIPRNSFTVITGLSGSGKSSLAFDTLFAEGQRRYVESLSAYIRQFAGRMEKPEVEYIKGISPAIAIEQKVSARNPRSTVGTSTEIYDYLKLLFARTGVTVSPVSGQPVKKHTTDDVVDCILALEEGCVANLLSPVFHYGKRKLKEVLGIQIQKGFLRVCFGNRFFKAEELEHTIGASDMFFEDYKEMFVLVDRIVVQKDGDADYRSRIHDSADAAFREGMHSCTLLIQRGDKTETVLFSNLFEADGITFEEPSVNLFSFNNPYGACKHCEGFGSVIGLDPDLIFPDKTLSVYEGLIAPWRGDKMQEWNQQLIKNAHKFDFPIHRPYLELNVYEKELLWKGNEYFNGLNAFFKYVEEQSYKIQYRVLQSRYRGKTVCPECLGTRLRKDASYVKVGRKSITELVLMPVKELLPFFQQLSLSEHDQAIAGRILIEIRNRLQYLNDVGLGYLTLNRLSNSLSGGESQRINLATALGSSLVGSMYILDEPSIGLHPRDTQRLIAVLKSLQQTGNTLVVVEHDEEIMRSSDEIIDMGPEAGTGGGEIVFQGSLEKLIKEGHTLTAGYMNGTRQIPVPSRRRPWKNFIEVKGAFENNLKGINVKFPLGVLSAVTGVSGSGKTSLVKKVFYPALKKLLGGYSEVTGSFSSISGDIDRIESVELVDQNPIGKSSRSNPVTYIKAFDEIRALFAETPGAKARGFSASHFSFNIPGGRCEACEGEGEITIEMQFMADIKLKCETCNGQRFREDILLCTYKDKNIFEVLSMTVNDAMQFFNSGPKSKFYFLEQKIAAKLQPLLDTGLGYIALGQSSSSLSGGEAQRIKLATFLSKGATARGTVFIFDEPTTGLHFHDINKLMIAFHSLINNGNSIIVIEHNPEVIKSADWVIDLGPDGGDDGGTVVFEGVPEDLIQCEKSVTGKFLKSKLS
jgi:excinuclease ABC subunit A